MHKYSFKELAPNHLSDCVRLGNKGDGGYVINERAIHKTTHLIGCGIADDWSFEEDFCKFKKDVKIYGLDPSVSNKVNMKRAFTAFLKLISFSRTGFRNFANRVRILREFRSFWRQPNAFFIQKGVSDVWHMKSLAARGRFTTLEETIRSIEKREGGIQDNSMFIKMDIDGSEYRVIPDILNFQRYVNGMTIEFHELDIVWEHFQTQISALKKHFLITHIHGCNGNSLIPNTNLPSMIELSFLKKDLVKQEELGHVINYPVKGLDFPHTNEAEEVPIIFSYA